MLKKLLSRLGIVFLLAALAFGGFKFYDVFYSKNDSKKTTPDKTTPALSEFDKSKYSTTNPESFWVVVNKQHQLNPKDYEPDNLVMPDVTLRVPGNESMQVRAETARALETMFLDAKKDGLDLMLASGYRSYQYQVGLYGGYVETSGATEADKTSARPGYSEHQTGLAADIEPATRECELETCFETTPEGKWLADNAYKYGFIIRYTKDKVDITGYEYEPWHVRYIGEELAKEMHQTDTKTLEEFFGISGGKNY